jgi:hypothetical protein
MMIVTDQLERECSDGKRIREMRARIEGANFGDLLRPIYATSILVT